MTEQPESGRIPLFEDYPLLEEKLPYVSLGHLPTPVEKLELAGSGLDLERLYIKRDDLSGEVYGGNKVRKLEFLLADALRERQRSFHDGKEFNPRSIWIKTAKVMLTFRKSSGRGFEVGKNTKTRKPPIAIKTKLAT